jgi:hypothetical protein
MKVDLRTIPWQSVARSDQTLLAPALAELERSGHARRLARYADAADYILALRTLVLAEARLVCAGRAQTVLALVEASSQLASELEWPKPLKPNEVESLWLSIDNWSALVDELRLSRGERGRLPLTGSVLVIVGRNVLRSGPNVFACASPRYPDRVADALSEARHSIGPLPARNTSCDESTLYAVESGPHASFVIRAEPLPENTWFDPMSYHEGRERDIAAAVLKQRCGDYPVATAEILCERVLGSFFEAVRHQGLEKALPMRIESGRIQGELGFEHRALGGEVAVIRAIEKQDGIPFLSLPRELVGGGNTRTTRAQRTRTIAAPDCTFLTAMGEEIPTGALKWLVRSKVENLRPPPWSEHIVRAVDRQTVARAVPGLAGVTYLAGVGLVGVAGTPAKPRFEIGLLVRSDSGNFTDGWGVRANLNDTEVLERAIRHAERQIARLRGGGEVDEAIRAARFAGVQRLQTEIPRQRAAREGLILAAATLVRRAGLTRFEVPV